ncbi:MAG: hypothetical protein WA738_19220 [Candidatus Angelobacter sp.]
MNDTSIVLVITLLLGSILVGSTGPAGGVPIPQNGAGVSSAQ